jgi:hypothetical protein
MRKSLPEHIPNFSMQHSNARLDEESLQTAMRSSFVLIKYLDEECCQNSVQPAMSGGRRRLGCRVGIALYTRFEDTLVIISYGWGWLQSHAFLWMPEQFQRDVFTEWGIPQRRPGDNASTTFPISGQWRCRTRADPSRKWLMNVLPWLQ